ncbi:MAG: 20-beta-hydroxysteroid dehydrogenase [Rhodospirillaceae bacterium]|nr:20-beta-hydroxysteroid dehydrogenase [Rhodospirillaceae bacterium]|tara:strand:+ start:257 stop:970 length:714 start_codon:yes stop_codon:yes gene_type:complete
MARTALVTGGNRGIGLEICRQLGSAGHIVILAARDAALGEEASASLSSEGLDVTAVTLDVLDHASIRRCAAELTDRGVEVDVLVNNAGVFVGGTLLSGPDPMPDSLGVNLLGTLETSRAFVPAMIERGWGRVVNVSSAWGSFAEGLEGAPAYAVTKAALNALTVHLAREAGPAVLVNAMCPGWVNTRMGVDSAPWDPSGLMPDTPPSAGADTALFLATLPDDGPTGGFFREREPLAW